MTNPTQQPDTQKPSPQPGATPNPKSPKQPQQEDTPNKQNQQQPKDKPLDPVKNQDNNGKEAPPPQR